MSTTIVTTNSKKRKLARANAPPATSAKKMVVKIPRGIVSTKVHKFIRSCSTGATVPQILGLDEYNGFTWNGVSTGGKNMQINFMLNGMNILFGGVQTAVVSMPNVAELTALYDQYQIEYVELEFYFSNNSSSVNSPSTALPLMYIVKDYDDSNSAGRTDLEQFGNCKRWQLGNRTNANGAYKIKVKPSVAKAMFQGVTTGYARGFNEKIDTQYPAVSHYGVKLAWDNFHNPTSTTVVGYLNVVAKYHITMYNTR